MGHEGITVFSFTLPPLPYSPPSVAKGSKHSRSCRESRSQFVASLLCKVPPVGDVTCGNEVLLLELGTRWSFAVTTAQVQEGVLSLRWESRREAIRSLWIATLPMESENHRMVWVGRVPEDHLGPSPAVGSDATHYITAPGLSDKLKNFPLWGRFSPLETAQGVRHSNQAACSWTNFTIFPRLVP